MQEKLQELKSEALSRLASIAGQDDLESFRVDYLGRKGKFTQFMRQIGSLPAAERPPAGQHRQAGG